jgi:glycosyltransferase involved in cell wall biosynthesis
MRISVAMCVYNGEHFLEEQLESIGRQIRLPDELVVCDDGSTDGSPVVIERFAARTSIPVRSFRNQANLRTTKNFEKAIGLCGGDVIATADQDDVWYPGKLARIEAEFDRSPDAGLVFSDADLIDGDGRPIGVRLWPSVKFSDAGRRRLERGAAFEVLLRRPVITGATMAFRSSLRDFVLPMLPGWTHDKWIGLMAASVTRLLPIAEPLMKYRRHSSNQIGVNGVTVAERMGRSLGLDSSRFIGEAEEYLGLRACLQARLSDRPDLLTLIDEKIAHFRVRGALPSSRLRRLPSILRELGSLRYSRYSGHTLSFARDLLAEI